MVKRIVKMTFRKEACDEFVALFEHYHTHIRHVPGCLSLQLLRAREPQGVFFTLSTWEHPDDLERYRHSELFAEVWPRTRALFAEPAEAWTTDVLFDL